MGGSAEKELVFDCPECGESLEVNPGMRDALLSKGCVICGAAVDEDAFSTACTS